MTDPVETFAWDAAYYLKDEADVAEYLAAAFETGEAADVTRALATIARSRGMSEMPKTAGSARDLIDLATGEGEYRMKTLRR